jgi:4,4'-diaponeurosporenoate glycosyltransferase
VLLVLFAGWLAGWALLWRLPALREPAAPRQLRTLTVVVPARNEADRLPRLLESLQRQTRRPDDTIVVDDHSTDGTARVARSFPGVSVVTAPDVPAGWTGKCWACSVGADAADGELLLFLDADVELADDALAALVSTWEVERGLLSVQPRHDTGGGVEVLSLPFNVVAMMGLGIGSWWPPRDGWGAAGPCMVTARVDYERVGGHAAVRHAVAEDIALADRYLAADLPVRCIAGHDRVRFRMYRDLRGIVEGWSKNMATGARRTPLLRALAVALWVTSALAAAGALVGAPTTPDAPAPVLLVLYLAGLVQIAVLGRRVGRFGAAAVVWPLLIVFFVAVFLWSAVTTFVVRRVRWSGRTLRLDAPATTGPEG